MKRSEMVDVIRKYLSQFESPYDLFENANESASDILRLLEDSGMLPPPLGIEAVTSWLVYCRYPKVEAEPNDVDLDRSRSQLWEEE